MQTSIEAREQEQENIDAQKQEGVVTPQATQREQELEDELSRLRKQLAAQSRVAPVSTAAPAARNFKVPKGEEKRVHALVTKQNGVAIAPELQRVQPFYYDQYEQISKTPGFEATVLHKGSDE